MQQSNKKKLKIMISSNHPLATSGYSTQAKHLFPLIRDEGYNLAGINFFGQEGHNSKFDFLEGLSDEGRKEILKVMNDDLKMMYGIRWFSRVGDLWGSDAMVIHGREFQPDVTMTLQDIWVLNPNDLKQLKRFIPIVPIDGDPVPPAVVERLRMAYRIVTYSQFGHRMLKDLGLHSTYIPHMVDTDVLKPMNKEQCRKDLALPQDTYLFGMVAANKDNPPRKSFQEVMDAFVMFVKKHPKSGLYFHTILQQQGGFPIHDYAKYLGILDKIWYLDPHVQMFRVNRDTINKLYNSFDALVSPSRSEGFGVPIIEAQAVGKPVIVNNYSAMPELVVEGKTGEITQVINKQYVHIGTYWATPSTKSIYEKMEAVYKYDKEKTAKLARERIIKLYEKKMVFDKYWRPFLQKLENEIHPASLTK